MTPGVYPSREDHTQIAITVVALTALSPFVVQNALLIDIDSAVLIPATLIILIAWTARQSRSAL